MRNFRGEIGRKIRYKMLSFKRIGFHFKMTNENVRFFSSFFLPFWGVCVEKVVFCPRIAI